MARPGGTPTGSVPAPSTGATATPPILGEVDQLIAQGKTVEAVLRAYPTAEEDVRRAFGLRLPEQWTHREFLREQLRADMGYVTQLLPRLYALYEPARYGSHPEVPVALLRDLLRAIYAEAPMYNLYRYSSGAPRVGRSSEDPGSPRSRPTAGVVPP